MKFFSVIFALISFSAFANPQLGEYIVHQGVASGKAVKLKTWYAMYSESKMMIRTETTVAGSPTQIDDEWIEEAEIFNHGTAIQILNLCAALGGNIEALKLPLGTFNTCKVKGTTLTAQGYSVPSFLGDAWIWLGDLPITGVAKAVGDDFSLELSSFQWNF